MLNPPAETSNPLTFSEIAKHFGKADGRPPLTIDCPACGKTRAVSAVLSGKDNDEASFVSCPSCDLADMLRELRALVRADRPAPAPDPPAREPDAVLSPDAILDVEHSILQAAARKLPPGDVPTVQDLVDLLETDLPVERRGHALARLLAWLEPAHDIKPELVQDLVTRWQQRPQPVQPDRRQTGIMAAPFVKRTKRRAQDYLPGLAPPRMPGLVTPNTAYLPGLEPDANRREIPALLTLFDVATGNKIMRGSAELSLAIFVEALLSTPTAERGEYGRVGPFSLGEIAGLWLQWKPTSYRATDKGTGAALQNALGQINTLAVPVGKSGWYIPLITRAVTGMAWDDLASFDVMLPPGADVGPQIDRSILRLLRKRSAPAYRAYLSLCFDWDYYGGRKGRLLRPTRPVAVRNVQGYVLTPGGSVVTGKGGVPVKSPYDPRAILTGEREYNPIARKRYPEYSADDLMRLCYPVNNYTGAMLRKRRQGARAAVALIKQVGGCVIEPVAPRKGDPDALPWRIMPPDPV